MRKYYVYVAGDFDLDSLLDVIDEHAKVYFDDVKGLLEKLLQTPEMDRDKLFSDSAERIDQYTTHYEDVYTSEDDGEIAVHYRSDYQWSDDDSYDDNEEVASLYFALEPPKDFEYEVIEL